MTGVRTLEVGCRGDDVVRWQAFLVQQTVLKEPPDGVFGRATAEATRRFQGKEGLSADGVVGPRTRRGAEAKGLVDTPPARPPTGFEPPMPDFAPMGSNQQRSQVFGRFDWKPAARTDNPEAIEITDDWAAKNLVHLEIPQLAGVPYSWGGVCRGRLLFHRRGAGPLKALFGAWQDAGLLSALLTFDGAFEARLQRGSHTQLSSHSFGSAFDINAPWNGLNKPCAEVGAKGSVKRLVPLANEHGFYWGGHFSTRPDGMHFEMARLT